MRSLTIEEMREIATRCGGVCLSKFYTNSVTKLRWRCVNGHEWEARPNNIKHGYWCPHCSGNAKLTTEEMQKLAGERGGECLSTKYTNGKTKLRWQCKKGHIWEAIPNSIKRNHWCPYCAGKARLNIEEMKTLATNHGGKCLSENYINLKSKLKWRCKEGYEWEATPGNIKSRGAWCMKCAGLDKLTIEEMRKLAVEHGGKCLSTIYKNNATKLLWRCADGHEWKATPSSITNSRWCPYCVAQIRENICRLIFENIFKLSFPKQRPKWLKNSRNNQMELDGYCEKLALAFEYHGEQHTTLSFFSNSESKLLQRKTDDELRRQLCKNNGIKLIEIPHTVDDKDLYDFIIFECKKNGVPIPEHKIVDYKKLKSTYHRQNL